ncbi:piezo-type mechanosensitive ion channel component-like isoform X2 [Rhynchophorus ferrugineus]|uniref:piezo-type mechanosensitive ion channel component-like isoform X2 n=1 Tax=Rhynchophorus ferrugineus TaxID=354439 RepID=UPI003FCCF926
MANFWLAAFLFRVVYPSAILLAVYIRPTVSSYVYMLLGLYMPFFSVPTPMSMARATGTYLKISLITCLLICLAIVGFYFVLYFPRSGSYNLENCSSLEIFLRTFGVVEFRNLPLGDAIAWLLPDPLMLLTVLALYFFLQKLTHDSAMTRNASGVEDEDRSELHVKQYVSIMASVAKYLLTFLVCVSAICRVSVFGLIYFFVFLCFLTHWAVYRPFSKFFARMAAVLVPVVFLHVSAIIFYQFQYFNQHEALGRKRLLTRLIQLYPYKTMLSCQDPRLFKTYFKSGFTAGLLAILFVMYIMCVLLTRHILKAQDGFWNFVWAFLRRERQRGAVGKWRFLLRKMQQKMAEEQVSVVFQAEHSIIFRIRSVCQQSLLYVITKSYLTANFIMMVWSITYVGWKSLILLVWANIMWLTPSEQKLMLRTSPFLILYIWFVLITNYLYSFSLSEQELPRYVGFLKLSSGSSTTSLRWLHLLVQSLFSVIIFSTMRQYRLERVKKKEREELAEIMGPQQSTAETTFASAWPKSAIFQSTGFFFTKWISLLWIWLVVVLMFILAYWGTVNLIKLVQAAFGILLVLSFQLCPFHFWKRCLPVYWWVLIVYSVVNLIFLYLYEVRLTQRFLNRFVASSEQFARFGIESHDISSRFIILVIPLVFQLAIVIQKNYLQKHFDKFTSPLLEEDYASESPDAQRGWKKVIVLSMRFKNLLFHVLELHLPKLLLLLGWCACVFDMCAFNFVFAVLLTISCFYSRVVAVPVLYTMSAWNLLLIMARTLYTHLYRNHHRWDFVGHYVRNGLNHSVVLNSAEWLGFRQSQFGWRYVDFEGIKWSFVLAAAVSLYRVVGLRQRHYRLARGVSTRMPETLFPDVDYRNCHDSTGNMIRFLVNYGYYRFGIELSAIVATIVLYVRMDLFSIIISIFLLVLLGRPRRFVIKMWFVVMLLLLVMVPFQYLMTLGFWPTFWDNTLTLYWNANDTMIRVQQFINQMNLVHPPKAKKLIFDFLLLLCMSRQWRAFRLERTWAGADFAGGNNEDVSATIDDPNVANPVPDFVGKTRNSLDVYKYLIFVSWFYVALLSTFFAGTMRPTIYSFGYIIGSFLLLWEGQDMFLRPPRSIIFRWNLLLYYNVFIMLFITLTQIFGCILVFHIENKYCRIMRLLSLGCVDDLGMFSGIAGLTVNSTCNVDKQRLGVGWDCVCFCFLIIQHRIFKSYYFFHLVRDAKAQAVLADRGAVLIEQFRQTQRQTLDAERKAMISNIDIKLLKIKKNRQQIDEIRAGNYAGFDDLERELNIPLIPSKTQIVDADFDPSDPMFFTEFLTMAIQVDASSVLQERRARRRRKRDATSATPSTQEAASTSLDQDSWQPAAWMRKPAEAGEFLLGMAEGGVVSITALLNHSTRSFRRVLAEVNVEKAFMKENPQYITGERVGLNQVWHPTARLSPPPLNNSASQAAHRPTAYEASIYVKLAMALWYWFLCYSEWLCYFCIVMRQVFRSDFISLPLLLMVFCWGSLSMPKPSKTFWVTSIAYVLIMLLICNFFVMDVVDWNAYQFENNKFYPPTIIGLRRNINTTFNIVMLSVLLFHRSLLQSLGLWKSVAHRTVKLLDDGDYELKNRALWPVPSRGQTGTGTRTYTVSSTQVPLSDYFPQSLMHGIQKYAEQFRLFTQQLLFPSSTQLPVDVYTPMFLCDLINLFIVSFFFYAFVGEGETLGFVGFLKFNRVPISFISVFLCLFGLMVFDRWIYKGRRRFVKILFHFFQVIAFHIWFFVLYPMVTQKTFNRTPPVQVFYVLKCLYFLFSAYQIRNGYPLLTSFHCLWSGYTLFHRFAFKMYILIPYLFEMRSLLDWTCTDSCLGVSQWFKMEDITNNIFEQMCERNFELLTDKGSGKRKNRKIKYLIGGTLFVLLTLTLILPFLLFSLSDTVGVTTRPARLKMSVFLGTEYPIFHAYAHGKTVTVFNQNLYMNLTKTFNNIEMVKSVFSTFQPEDIIAASWSRFSLTTWDMSPSRFEEFVSRVGDDKEPLFARLTIEYLHQGHGGDKKEKTFGQTSYALAPEERDHLLQMLTNASATEPVFIPAVLPKFLQIDKEGKPTSLPMMELISDKYSHGYESDKTDDEEDDDDDARADSTSFRSLLVALQRDSNKYWWEMQEYCSEQDENYQFYLKDLVMNTCDNIVVYVFNEKVFSSTISYVTASGILGMYLIYFMIIFSLIREMMIKAEEIWIEDIPNPEVLLRKCLEVYVARDIGNFELEEEIFEELVFIMRSREICIRLTKEV